MDNPSQPESPRTQPLLAAAILGFMAVALGAFGAHGLRETLEARDMTRAWETAVQYQFYHVLALMFLAAIPLKSCRLLHLVSASWTLGIFLFSGSLYLMCLGGPRWLGPITPVGGGFFLTGWVLLACIVLKPKKQLQDA